jgi:hypothetical protein
MHISTEETIAATIAARTAYFESVQEKPLPKDYLTEIVAPENIKIGDYMLQYGCVYKVTEIQDVTYSNDDTTCYLVTGLYVCGSLKMYKTFLRERENGCALGHHTCQQGNNRATWTKVVFTEKAAA